MANNYHFGRASAEKSGKSLELAAIAPLAGAIAMLSLPTNGAVDAQNCSAASANNALLPARIPACSDKVRGSRRAKKNAALARLAS